MLLRQRLNQLLTCIEDMSSDDEANEEVSRSLDEAFQLCGSFIPPDSFRLTHAHSHRYTNTKTEEVPFYNGGLETAETDSFCKSYSVSEKEKIWVI